VGTLSYLAIASVDGYIEDESGEFGWAAPSDEVHAFVNDLERSVGTYLYGRGMYETMVAWETWPGEEEASPVTRDFAEIWRAADKVVYSSTLEAPKTARTRIEHDFDPDAVRSLKGSSAADIGIGGAELAAHAFRAGLVDECHLFLVPAIVGGGKRALPDGIRMDLELLDERSFENGTVFLRYRVSA
jgi:dihydrofolate reductase